MVIGAFANTADADVCLSNLAEAGFTATTISVVTGGSVQAPARARGPLQSMPVDAVWDALRTIGVADADLATYRQTLDGGGVLIAITAKPGVNAAAQEMLSDHNAIGLATVAANPAKPGRRPR